MPSFGILTDDWINQGNALENKGKNLFGVKKKKKDTDSAFNPHAYPFI